MCSEIYGNYWKNSGKLLNLRWDALRAISYVRALRALLVYLYRVIHVNPYTRIFYFLVQLTVSSGLQPTKRSNLVRWWTWNSRSCGGTNTETVTRNGLRSHLCDWKDPVGVCGCQCHDKSLCVHGHAARTLFPMGGGTFWRWRMVLPAGLGPGSQCERNSRDAGWRMPGLHLTRRMTAQLPRS
jgi:hypothetical protein